MTILENQLNATIDKLCAIKSQLKQGKVDSALLQVRALESSLYQSLAILSLEQHGHIENITCDDYPALKMVKTANT